jgi:hypothetical protein
MSSNQPIPDLKWLPYEIEEIELYQHRVNIQRQENYNDILKVTLKHHKLLSEKRRELLDLYIDSCKDVQSVQTMLALFCADIS